MKKNKRSNRKRFSKFKKFETVAKHPRIKKRNVHARKLGKEKSKK